MRPDLEERIRPWRERIDALDGRIVELLNQRAECTLHIGAIKREAGVPIYDAARERDILGRVSRAGSGPLEAAAIQRLFERILDESRWQERAWAASAGPGRQGEPT